MSRTNFGAKTWLMPEPVLVVCTYNEDGSVDAMPAAWGGLCQDAPAGIMIDLAPDHKTTENIKRVKAFTVAIPSVDNIAATDYFGIVSGNKEPKKFEKSGMRASKSAYVDAPIVEEYKMILECKLFEILEIEGNTRVVGEIVNVNADDSVLSDGKIDAKKLRPVVWNPVTYEYLELGGAVGCAWNIGKSLM